MRPSGVVTEIKLDGRAVALTLQNKSRTITHTIKLVSTAAARSITEGDLVEWDTLFAYWTPNIKNTTFTKHPIQLFYDARVDAPR